MFLFSARELNNLKIRHNVHWPLNIPSLLKHGEPRGAKEAESRDYRASLKCASLSI